MTRTFSNTLHWWHLSVTALSGHRSFRLLIDFSNTYLVSLVADSLIRFAYRFSNYANSSLSTQSVLSPFVFSTVFVCNIVNWKTHGPNTTLVFGFVQHTFVFVPVMRLARIAFDFLFLHLRRYDRSKRPIFEIRFVERGWNQAARGKERTTKVKTSVAGPRVRKTTGWIRYLLFFGKLALPEKCIDEKKW